MNAEQLLEDVSAELRNLIYNLGETRSDKLARAALAVAIEACAKVAFEERGVRGVERAAVVASINIENRILALKPKD